MSATKQQKKLLRKLVIAKMNCNQYNRTEMVQLIKEDRVFSGRQISGMISYLEFMKWATKSEEGIYSFDKERYENDKRILKRIKNKKTIKKIKQESQNLKHKQLSPILKSVTEILEKSMKFMTIPETRDEMNYMLDEINIQLKEFLLSIQILKTSSNDKNKEIKLFETIFELFLYVIETYQTRPFKPFAFIVQRNKDFTYHDLLLLYELYCTKKRMDPFSLHVGSHDTKFLFHYLQATNSYLLQYQSFSEIASFLNRTDDSIQYIYRKEMKLKKDKEKNSPTPIKDISYEGHNDYLFSLNDCEISVKKSNILTNSFSKKEKNKRIDTV